ncbi:MAG: hypothetical protein LBK42_11350 [Propionibacteriaceae bacterium]|nr:hypothetical protein [Propionibacteriaceae bacterium]
MSERDQSPDGSLRVFVLVAQSIVGLGAVISALQFLLARLGLTVDPSASPAPVLALALIAVGLSLGHTSAAKRRTVPPLPAAGRREVAAKGLPSGLIVAAAVVGAAAGLVAIANVCGQWGAAAARNGW